ncbi:hypothetical protein QFZ67_006628 [Streptomyces sp. V1I1]|nr:DUF1445 domain-containing protein [Streptomyces sp. V1I1]MDQ0944923.1 hypothetical protein [Streptomyces sp. V1I1]
MNGTTDRATDGTKNRPGGPAVERVGGHAWTPDAARKQFPVFWACGVTPQAAETASRQPFAVTHAPGQMFIMDARDEQYRVA